MNFPGYISDALITPSGKYFVTAEEGRVQIWNTATRVVLYRDEQGPDSRGKICFFCVFAPDLA